MPTSTSTLAVLQARPISAHSCAAEDTGPGTPPLQLLPLLPPDACKPPGGVGPEDATLPFSEAAALPVPVPVPAPAVQAARSCAAWPSRAEVQLRAAASSVARLWRCNCDRRTSRSSRVA